MKTLEAKLGYHFQNPALLEHALTHSSYANEHHLGSISSNERLEFLGDSVLGMIVADYLYRTFPSLPEGDLTRIRANLVCENSLVLVAKALDLGRYLKLGKGENASWPTQWRLCWPQYSWTADWPMTGILFSALSWTTWIR